MNDYEWTYYAMWDLNLGSEERTLKNAAPVLPRNVRGENGWKEVEERVAIWQEEQGGAGFVSREGLQGSQRAAG